MKYKDLNNEQIQKIILLYYEGYGADAICKNVDFDITRSIVYTCLKKNDIKRRDNKHKGKKFFLNEDYFEDINNERKAYWLGFIYADGYITKKENSLLFGISLSNKDIDILERLKQDLNATYKIHNYYSSGYSNSLYSRFLITSDKMVNDLINHGVVFNKTNILQPPNIDKTLIPYFIKGYFDGDGCITKNSNTNEYNIKILGTDEMLDFINEYIKSNNIADIKHYYKRKENQIVSSLEIHGNHQVLNFLNHIYNNNTFCMYRKYERYIELCKLYNVEPNGNIW